MTVEELNIVISANDRKFNEAIGDVIGRLDDLEEQSRRSTDDIGNFFTNLGHKLAALGIGKIIGDSIMSGGELEQQLGGVEVVFSEHAESMRKAAATAYKDMGLSESDYLAKANKMGALLKGSGFDTGYASAMSQQVMQRASDVASIMGVDVKDAMEAVTGAAKGNFTMMDNLGVAMNDTTLQAYAQEKGLGKLETTQQKVSAAMQMFLDKTEYAAGNYARENDTFSGSLTTTKAQLENMTADLGAQLLPTATSLLTMARGGLEAISPLVVSLGNGLNSVAQYLIGLSPSAKTLLGIAVGAAVAIPAATKAHVLWTAANEKWNSLLNILIPKEAKRANIMKAAAGWLVILAGLLSIVASVGATAREMNESEGAAMEDTAAGADKAAESTDSLSDSMAGLGKSADTAKKKLADIDTLNVFDSGSSTGGVDFSAIVDGAESAQDSIAGLTDDLADVTGNLDELSEKTNSFSLDGLSKNFGDTFKDIRTGFATFLDGFNFNSDTQLDSLRVLDSKVRELFGDDWSDFWTGVGSTMYRAFGENNSEYDRYMALTDIQNWLEDINGFLTGWMGEFGEAWKEFWMGIGSWIYEQLNPEPTDYSTQHKEGWGSGRMRGVDNAEYSPETYSAGSFSGKMRGYDYADYSTQQSSIPGAVYSGGAMTGPVQLPDSSAAPQIIEFHNYIDLDGQIIAENTTQYQNNEQTRSNGY